jgi:hypothetical protein
MMIVKIAAVVGNTVDQVAPPSVLFMIEPFAKLRKAAAYTTPERFGSAANAATEPVIAGIFCYVAPPSVVLDTPVPQVAA